MKRYNVMKGREVVKGFASDGVSANPVGFSKAMQCDKKSAIRFDGKRQGNDKKRAIGFDWTKLKNFILVSEGILRWWNEGKYIVV